MVPEGTFGYLRYFSIHEGTFGYLKVLLGT